MQRGFPLVGIVLLGCAGGVMAQEAVPVPEPVEGAPVTARPVKSGAATGAAVSVENQQKLHAAFEELYNLDFIAAHSHFEEVIDDEPESATARAFLASALLYEMLAHQGTLQSQLFVTSNEFLKQKRDPPDPALQKEFLEVVASAQAKAGERLKKDREDADGLFALALSYGNRATYEAGVNGKYLRGFRLGEKSYDTAQRLRALHPAVNDAHVFLGVRNYVVGSLSRWQRFLVLLMGARGNREQGLQHIRTAAASHSLIVSSNDPEAICVPSGEKATLLTLSSCPRRVAISSRVASSHSLIVLSLDPEASCVPSGEKATLLT